MPLEPDQKEIARDLLANYLRRAEDYRARIHYSQARPMSHLGRAPENGFTADCSGYVTGAFYWADQRSKFKLKDPNGLNYSGWGFTGTLLSYNRSGRVPLDRKFFVGDMALFGSSFGNTQHVIICRKNGLIDDAIWSSLGSEPGPNSVNLRYRGDLLCVLRAEDLR